MAKAMQINGVTGKGCIHQWDSAADEALLDNPTANIDKVLWHTDWTLFKTVTKVNVSVTVPARTFTGSQTTHNITDHLAHTHNLGRPIILIEEADMHMRSQMYRYTRLGTNINAYNRGYTILFKNNAIYVREIWHDWGTDTDAAFTVAFTALILGEV